MTDTWPGWADDAEPRPHGDGDGERAGTKPPRHPRRHANPSRHARQGRRNKKPRRPRTALTLVILAVLVALLALIVLFAVQARAAYNDLQSAMPLVTELEEHALAGDVDAAASTVTELQDHTAGARNAIDGPHWSLAAKAPWLGPNVVAAQTATEVVDDLATDALSQLVAATEVIDPARLAPEDGRIDLAPFTEVAPQVIAADTAVGQAQERLAEIDTTDVIEQLRGPLTDLETQLDDVAGLTATASRAVQLIPPMLGAEEPRDYLLLVQNNAEPRATGGLTGAVILLRADDGAIELVEQRSAGEVGHFPEPAVELTDTEVALFGSQLGRYPGNVTATPHFPRSAEIITEMWRQGVGGEVDGVLSVDPVALGSLLDATGPIDLPQNALATAGVPAEALGGQPRLTAENAAPLMLNGIYRHVADPDDQDTFFELAAAAIFSGVMSGGADPTATVTALAQAADDGRLHVWSTHEDEQALLDGTVLSGELRGDDGAGAPVVGVYVNDLSAAKIAYYQEMDVELEPQECRPDGSQDLTVTVTLRSAVPDGAADLPVSLVGTGNVVPQGHMRSNLLVYAPTGGRITDVRSSDEQSEVFPQLHEGQVVVARRVVLPPGESVTVELDVTTGPGYTEDALLRTTPGPGNERFTSFALTCPR